MAWSDFLRPRVEAPSAALSVATVAMDAHDPHRAAHERVAVPYAELARVDAAGPSSFAAIMTHDHTRDAVALAALEPLEWGYLGLLGSRAKVRRFRMPWVSRVSGSRQTRTPAWARNSSRASGPAHEGKPSTCFTVRLQLET